jgi:hypothetical protein
MRYRLYADGEEDNDDDPTSALTFTERRQLEFGEVV